MRQGIFFKTIKTIEQTYMVDITTEFLKFIYPCKNNDNLDIVLSRVHDMYLYDFYSYVKNNYNGIIKFSEEMKQYYLVFKKMKHCDAFVSDINLRFLQWISGQQVTL